MVKRLKKRPSTSSSLYDFSDPGGLQSPQVKTIKLIDGQEKV